MKNPEVIRERRRIQVRKTGFLFLTVLLCFLWASVVPAFSSDAGHAAADHAQAAEAAGHGDHGEGHGGGTKGWVATDTYRVLNFGILAIALFFLLRKPVKKALNARIEGIQEQLADLEAKKAEAEKALNVYARKLAELDAEAEKIVSQYIQQGEEAKARILKEAEAAAEKMEEQARKNIAHEFEQAKNKLKQEIVEKTLVKAEALLRASITGDDQDRLVDEYIEKVVA